MALETAPGYRPAATVVVPVWDGYVRWLRGCLDSIVAQRHEYPFEVLVVDNASSDTVPEPPAGVRILRLEKRVSVGAARNAALSLIDTEFVAFADADDLFPPGYFRFAFGRLDERPGLVAVGMRPVALDDETGEETPFPWPTDGAIAAARAGRRRLALRGMLVEPSIVMSGSAFRVAALRRAGGYSDGSYGEDANLALLLPFIGEVELHEQPHRRYRIHAGSIARSPVDRTTLEAVYADARRRLVEHPAVPLWAKALMPWMKRYHRRRIAAALDGSENRRVLGNAERRPR